MYTKEELEKYPKESLLEALRSFDRGERKYYRTTIIQEYYALDRERKEKLIDLLLLYQKLCPDDPIQIPQDERELSRQAYRRLTARKLHELCVELGSEIGVINLHYKQDCIRLLLGEFPFDCEQRVLTEEEKEAFLLILRDQSLTSRQVAYEIRKLREKYSI